MYNVSANLLIRDLKITKTLKLLLILLSWIQPLASIFLYLKVSSLYKAAIESLSSFLNSLIETKSQKPAVDSS